MSALPALPEVREFVGIPSDLLSDEDLVRMFSGSVSTIARACRGLKDETGGYAADWPDELVEAVLRRVQRKIAAKSLPLGVLDQAGEYGPAKIPAYDQLIEELEGPYRQVVFG